MNKKKTKPVEADDHVSAVRFRFFFVTHILTHNSFIA